MVELEICSKIEQRSVIKFLVAEKCKPNEIFRTFAVYEKACFNSKMSTNELNYSREENRLSMKTGQEDLQSENFKHVQIS